MRTGGPSVGAPLSTPFGVALYRRRHSRMKASRQGSEESCSQAEGEEKAEVTSKLAAPAAGARPGEEQEKGRTGVSSASSKSPP